jgi:hypothetical protein
VEPNDTRAGAQTIVLRPQVLHGYMKGLSDTDHFSFQAKQGERWLFDVQSIERGGFLESSLTLYDESGHELGFNEDQDEYLETPRLSAIFARDGRYTLKVDQYRGPQGVACGENCGYSMQISQLPVAEGVFPLGARPGTSYRARIHGEALQQVTGAYLQRARGAEHYRLTFPFSMPLDGSDSDHMRIAATSIHNPSLRSVEASFEIPANAKPGLWRLWLQTPRGVAEAMSIEIDADPLTIDGLLETQPANSYPVALEAGKPFHAWTLATQLGLPAIDTVLELWSEDGKLLAEHDDLMTGQGTVIGNPDSSLYYKPQNSERAKLVVRDRTGRAGPSFAYRLHISSEEPSFQLITETEDLSMKNEAMLEVLLIKQPGFEKAVEVWIGNLPAGMTATTGHFRADQHFGPSGDGDNINIPVVSLTIRAAGGVAAGEYPIRVLGRAADKTGPVVEAFATLCIGPAGKRNDTRRPLPAIGLHVGLR